MKIMKTAFHKNYLRILLESFQFLDLLETKVVAINRDLTAEILDFKNIF